MPTYDYECSRCGHRFERVQKMTDKPVRVCPECAGPVRRLIGTGAAVVIKGSGSRATDNSSLRERCGRDKPCCGRDTPCDRRPCDE